MDALKKIEILNMTTQLLASKGALPTPVNIIYALDEIGALIIPAGNKFAGYARRESEKELVREQGEI